MAEFQLVVSYKPPQTKLALLAVLLFFPVWSIVAPMILAAFGSYVLSAGSSVPPLITVLVCSLLLSLWWGGFVLSALCEDFFIHVSKNGLSFPPFLLPRLGLRRSWLWSDIRSATVIGADKQRTILLGMTSGLSLPLAIRYLQPAKLEEFLLALEVWGVNCQRSDELIEYQREVQNQKTGIQVHSYTKMWQEELGRRFTATTFVPLEPGRTLQGGKLKVVRQMAFGGLSAIYLVQKDETQLLVLKEAVVPANADPQARANAEEHLARESRMLFCLFHPNVARVLDHFVEEGRHYLLMEYVPGQDLRQLVKQNGPCDEKMVIEWAIVIADILKFLHNQNPAIIHRDLTPDNLVLKNDGDIVLIDFGASNEFVGTATGTMVGKQAYIAPEQLRGKAVPESDLYSLGGTIYFLLTARDPLPLAAVHIRTVLPNVSQDIADLLESLTAFEKKDRIATAADLLARLKAMQSNRAAMARGGK